MFGFGTLELVIIIAIVAVLVIGLIFRSRKPSRSLSSDTGKEATTTIKETGFDTRTFGILIALGGLFIVVFTGYNLVQLDNSAGGNILGQMVISNKMNEWKNYHIVGWVVLFLGLIVFASSRRS